jgi:hypothetical protein
MVDLTNGAGVSYSFEDEDCKQMIESGDFWQKLFNAWNSWFSNVRAIQL